MCSCLGGRDLKLDDDDDDGGNEQGGTTICAANTAPQTDVAAHNEHALSYVWQDGQRNTSSSLCTIHDFVALPAAADDPERNPSVYIVVVEFNTAKQVQFCIAHISDDLQTACREGQTAVLIF